jgi:peptidoglycan/LPS O-acetylase OafA/YrhL
MHNHKINNIKSRIFWLDELRGIAAFSVVLFHFFTNYNVHYTHDFNVPEAFSYGRLGVNLFFIISGFVIFMTVSKLSTIKQFIISRFSRLYPVFWVAVTITFIWTIFLGPEDRAVNNTSYLLNLSMIHEYLSIPHVDKVYWTLTIELAFYFWISCLLITKQLKNINYYLIIVVFLSLFYEYLPTLLRQLFILKSIPFFAAGICFYLSFNNKDSILTKLVFILVIVHILKYYTLIESGILLFALTYIYFQNTIKRTQNRILVYLGSISYSLYLIHQNIGYSIIQKGYELGVPSMASILLAILFTLLLATLLTYFVEKPAAKICKKIFNKTTKGIR